MKIALCHNMQYAGKAKEVQNWFRERGHEAFPSSFNESYLGLSDEEKDWIYERSNFGRRQIGCSENSFTY